MINNILIAITNNSDKFDSNNPLTFTAQEAGSTVKLTATGSPVIDGLQYRTNNAEVWQPYTIDTVITLTNVDDYVQFQNTKEQLSLDSDNYVQFVMYGEETESGRMNEGKIAASGNIQSMLKDSTSCYPYCYYYMFGGCESLTVAPELPATNLANGCYNSMFQDCTSLTSAPKLPATKLANYCYNHMFSRL